MNPLALFWKKKHPAPESGTRIFLDSEGVLLFRISGVLTKEGMDRLQSRMRKLMESRRDGDLRTLVLLEGFLGWKTGDDWGDMAFFMSHGDRIARIALVGEAQWESSALAFMGAGVRRADVRYFGPLAQGEARAWLMGGGG
jgi:hypothetical protein